jgi:hypothetical protein
MAQPKIFADVCRFAPSPFDKWVDGQAPGPPTAKIG